METTRRFIPDLLLCVALPFVLRLVDPTIPSGTLVKLGIVAGLYVLALRGIRSYFPKESFDKRTLVTMIEHHALMGLTLAAGLTLFGSFFSPGVAEANASQLLTGFFLQAVFFALLMFMAELVARWWMSKPFRTQ
jgi:hypothetical protein